MQGTQSDHDFCDMVTILQNIYDKELTELTVVQMDLFATIYSSMHHEFRGAI
jgi:hypothetical protein